MRYSSVAEAKKLIEAVPDNALILVDFDETLLLRNSTEEYLRTIQPRVFGVVLLLTLRLLQPWNWLPGKLKGDVSRDWMRVLLSTLFFPWTLLLWQRQAQQLAVSYPNAQLIELITAKPKSNIIIATQGFDFIVRPIVKQLSIKHKGLVACRFWRGGIDRSGGKYKLVVDALGEQAVTQSAVITDSTDDKQLLESAAFPCLVRWSEARYVPALSGVYMPFVYMERVKRPGAKFFLKTVLCDDFPTLVLALSWLSSSPILHTFMLLFLLLSFWSIYELGYRENDIVAEKFEKEPTLSETFHSNQNQFQTWQPWLWAILLAIPGTLMLVFLKTGFDSLISSAKLFIIHLTIWLAFLVIVRISYWLYNYADKQTRVWLYPMLQFYKYFGFLTVAPTNLVGAVLFTAQMLSRWLSYIVYRFSIGDRETLKYEWKKMPNQVFRLVFFILLLAATSLGIQSISLAFNWQTLVILAWCIFRSYRQIGDIVRGIRPISAEL
jgi:hypothetical protein